VISVNGGADYRTRVRPGERIRLRLVNPSNGRVYRPDFGALEPMVIAVDGMYVREPFPLAGFELAPGNRLDLDLTIPPSARGEYPVVDRFTRRPHLLVTILAQGEPVATPSFTAPRNPHVPRWAGASEEPVDVTFVLDAQRCCGRGRGGIEWTINGRPWGDHQITQLEEGRWTRVRFENRSRRLHPMHLHGQFFRVIARNGSPASEPHFRDTVLLHGRETIDVGMVPIDWGRWVMHCHILEHAEAGMMTEVEVSVGGSP
jgi:FtsP/CotA-like multicopper oxidase with cupredoxin domain